MPRCIQGAGSSATSRPQNVNFFSRCPEPGVVWGRLELLAAFCGSCAPRAQRRRCPVHRTSRSALTPNFGTPSHGRESLQHRPSLQFSYVGRGFRGLLGTCRGWLVAEAPREFPPPWRAFPPQGGVVFLLAADLPLRPHIPEQLGVEEVRD